MEEKHFVPTELGTVVSDLLVKHFPKLMDSGFTAEMELNLDKVAEGKLSWISLLKDFAKYLYPALDAAVKEMEQVKRGRATDIVCEKCGSPMVIKFGKNGEFLACSSYPECKNTKNFRRDENGNIQMVEVDKEYLEVVGKCLSVVVNWWSNFPGLGPGLLPAKIILSVNIQSHFLQI